VQKCFQEVGKGRAGKLLIKVNLENDARNKKDNYPVDKKSAKTKKAP
jgi:hypothetical protein